MMRQIRKLPTIVGLLILVIGVSVGVFLVQTRQTINSSASPEEAPKSLRITNITDNSFTVSWITSKKVGEFVNFGKSQSLGQTAGGETQLAHHVTVSDLSASTTYLFKVGSGNATYDNNGDFYKVKTGPSLPSQNKNDVVFGSVVSSSGVPVSGAIVYVSLPGASALSTVTDAKGAWTLSLSNARTTTLETWATYGKTTNLEIFVQSERGEVSTATIQVQAARPVPTMSLGKNYNFNNVKTPESSGLPSSTIQLAAVATPSPSAIPTPTPTSTLRSSPTPTVTPIPTKIPTRASTPTIVHPATVSAATTLPNAGDLTPLIWVSIMGLSIFASGFLLAKVVQSD